MRETMSAPEAARALRYDLSYLHRLIWSGRIPATKDGNGHWQIESRHVRERIADMEKRRGTAVAQ